MKNKLMDLNDHLFMQLERLSDEDLSAEQIDQECKRADAIVSVSDQIISGATTQLKAATLIATHGDRFAGMLPAIGGTGEATAVPQLNGTGAGSGSSTATAN